MTRAFSVMRYRRSRTIPVAHLKQPTKQWRLFSLYHCFDMMTSNSLRTSRISLHQAYGSNGSLQWKLERQRKRDGYERKPEIQLGYLTFTTQTDWKSRDISCTLWGDIKEVSDRTCIHRWIFTLPHQPLHQVLQKHRWILRRPVKAVLYKAVIWS